MFRHLTAVSRFLLRPAVPTQSTAILGSLRDFSLLSSNNICGNASPLASSHLTTSLLQPPLLIMNFDRGMKQKGRLRKRCKDCYFVMREERLYVMCKTHPRHKQMAMKKSDKNSWIITDATQSPLRAW